MRRPLFLSLVLLAACDPELTLKSTPGVDEGGAPEGGRAVTSPEQDAGAQVTDAGDDASTTEDAGDAATAHQVDGVNDFTAGEKLQTTSSSSNYFAYASWDAKNVYLGMEGADVAQSATNAASKWILVYLGVDGLAGTTTGIRYGSAQQPTLPFSAGYHLRFKIDGSYTNVQKWDASGSAWVDAGVVGVPVLTVGRQGTFFEMSFTRASLGNPAAIRLHMNMLVEGGGNDWTYAGAPSTSFTDGKDPSFTKYHELTFASATAPNAQPIKP